MILLKILKKKKTCHDLEISFKNVLLKILSELFLSWFRNHYFSYSLNSKIGSETIYLDVYCTAFYASHPKMN